MRVWCHIQMCIQSANFIFSLLQLHFKLPHRDKFNLSYSTLRVDCNYFVFSFNSKLFTFATIFYSILRIMSFRNLFVFVLACASLKYFVFSAHKYEQISSCKATNDACDGCRYGKFICGETNRENAIFHSDAIDCGADFNYYKKYFGTIDFENCRFTQKRTNFFEIFPTLHTFNISNTELETLQMKMFLNAKNLKKLIAFNNYLTEVPAHLFAHVENLDYIDFANNTINRIDSFAFDGLSSLETLNLSYNPIGNLEIRTFAHLSNLKDLKLKHANISSIQLGTFSFQHRLISLDLSENNLKQFDFKLFYPILSDF